MPLTHSGWSVWISVDGEELPQYSVKVEEQPGLPPDIPKFYTVSGWIPSKVGKEFIINFDYNSTIKRKTACAVDVKIDGNSVGGKFCGLTNILPSSVDGYLEDDGKSRKPFVFTTLDLTDEEVGNDSINLKDLGTLQISLQRTELLHYTESASSSSNFLKGLSPTVRVHEKTKKIGCHRVLLGEARKLPLRGRFCETRDIDNVPFLTFIFHYRSEDILRAQEIIPPPPAPPADPLALGAEANPIDIDVEGVNSDPEVDDEIRVLEEKLNTYNEQLKNLKKRKGKKNDSNASSKRPKIEDDDVKPFIKGEVIDLC
ncbi:hypothetical protein M422DRAFT_63956 [Sphaerobolus stellatus SS14]|nr:hypothetical protein M422DRAFT_63956 [Sphaerobolus stellatus SS14]